MKLFAFRKVGAGTAHLFDDHGVSLCGLRLGLEPEWPKATFFEHSSCQKCAKARNKLIDQGTI